MINQSLRRIAGIILVIEALLLFVPVAVLGAAINWPASLDEPAAVMLPAILAQASAVRIGYTIYMLYSVLFWPVALLVARLVSGGEALSPSLRIAAGFGVASALARCIGIIRWLVAMPALAAIYTDLGASEATRAAVVVSYQALNGFGGSIGEVLGVGVFAGLWLLIVSVTILRGADLPRWLGAFGIIAGVGLMSGLVELFGVSLGPLISITTTLIQLWFLAAGVVLLSRRAPAPARQAARS
jgi:hypothetical protein